MNPTRPCILLITSALLASAHATDSLSPLPSPTPSPDVEMTGTVEDSRTIEQRRIHSDFYYVRLKVKVESVEKGAELIAGASYLDVRCWREISSTGSTGHSFIPADGARFHARLIRQVQGEFEPLLPDGLEAIDAAAGRIYPPFTRRRIGFWQVAGGLFGLLVLCTTVFIRLRAQDRRPRTWSDPH